MVEILKAKLDQEEEEDWFLYIASPQHGDRRLFRLSVRPGYRWLGSNPRQKGPCRFQGGLAGHCATDAPLEEISDMDNRQAGEQCCLLFLQPTSVN
ncbi:hypothetical protein PoB_003725000 [Plakobranchus ocellatus]|uniref:Uncharacterized protein n=1 Tax=Plakobranchus ocellatus TaxID=259542 RepID=A0AAV4ATV4_9GAST|nr:hypothetical protein PoB_003725000 [Plakobranchus ocellatus]